MPKTGCHHHENPTKTDFQHNYDLKLLQTYGNFITVDRFHFRTTSRFPPLPSCLGQSSEPKRVNNRSTIDERSRSASESLAPLCQPLNCGNSKTIPYCHAYTLNSCAELWGGEGVSDRSRLAASSEQTCWLMVEQWWYTRAGGGVGGGLSSIIDNSWESRL